MFDKVSKAANMLIEASQLVFVQVQQLVRANLENPLCDFCESDKVGVPEGGSSHVDVQRKRLRPAKMDSLEDSSSKFNHIVGLSVVGGEVFVFYGDMRLGGPGRE